MEDELSQLDELIESDILDALGEDVPQPEDQNIEIESSSTDEIVIEDFTEEEQNTQQNNIETLEDEELLEKNWELELNNKDDNIKQQNEAINMVDVNTTDLASLLSQLLNNKTIEITIKIKD